ncbi:MAG: protein kinase [Chloroflexi bacterium]|nr:protein kinase [Chloroflexota bacterium]
MSADLIGKMVNGYEILSQVGQGGMATVFLARQRSMNRNVALKILPSAFSNDATYLQRFKREVKIVSQLEHRNIVPVYDFGEFESQPYIAMRYMPAGSVEELLAAGRIPLLRILSIVEQVSSALDYAHRNGILHRDLKPSNILLDDGGGVFITDFGIARIMSEGGSQVTTQGVVGTPSYMSPEQARAEPLDRRSDVYSLGVMLFELVTGRRPFESDTPYSLAVMHVTMPPPLPRQFEPGVSAALEEVIMRALSKTRDARYTSAGELAAALREALEDRVTGGEGKAVLAADTRSESPSGEFGESSTTAPAPLPVAVPPQVASTTSDTSPAASPPVSLHRRPERRRRNVLLWVTAGGALGCALLVGVVILAVPLFGILSRNAAITATATAVALVGRVETNTAEAPAADTVTATPQREAGINRLQLTRSALNEAADATFTAESVIAASRPTSTRASIQPVGLREQATLIPPLQSVDGELVYFTRSETGDGEKPQFEIAILDLASWEIRRFEAGEGSSTYPMPSPDGRWIAFQSDRDGDFELYVTNRYGGQLRRLTQNSVLDRLAAWSPVGDRIIHSTDTRGDGTFDLRSIYQIDGDGQRIYSDGWRNSHARFSPDGKFIVFTAGPAVQDASTWEIRLLDRESGETRLLTDNDVRDASPAFHPDGQRILYVTTIGGASALASMNLEGQDRRILYTGPGSVWSANYSPDGKFIVLTATVNGLDQLFLMDARGGGAQQITASGGAYASWIPRSADV